MSQALPVWVMGVRTEKAGRVGVDAIFMTAWGALSLALFTGKYIVTKTHPVLGTIAAIFALGNAASLVTTATEA